MGLEIQATLRVYEIDGEDTHMDEPPLVLRSHWNFNRINGFVIIEIAGKKYTVAAEDLAKAVERCRGLS